MERYHQDWSAGRFSCDVSRYIQTVHGWHLKIEYDEVMSAKLKSPYRFYAISDRIANAPTIVLLQDIPEIVSYRGIVVCD
jgi:hypothetical protein